MLFRRSLLISTALLLAACGDGTPSDPAAYSEVPYKIIISSMQPYSQPINWETVAFSNIADLTTFWKTTYGDNDTPPTVDFSKNNIVGIQLSGSSGCVSVQINEVSQNHQNTQVRYSYKYPTNVSCTQSIIDLTTFLTVPKQGNGLASVSFIREKAITYSLPERN